MQYISFYDHEINDTEKRAFSPAGRDITAYIANVFCNICDHVEIISPILTKNSKGLYKGKTYQTPEGFFVTLPASFGTKTLVGKCFKRLWQKCVLFFWVVYQVKAETAVTVYHSISLTKVVWILKKIKRCKIILQVEEIYGDVLNKRSMKKKEQKALDLADAFIFPTEMLSRIVNTKNKPYAVVHGNYRIVPICGSEKKDGKIHCVYAGTFDRVKGGVFKAIEAAEFLDENYVIHILGFGCEKEVNQVKTEITNVKRKTHCDVRYEGLKTGDEFVRFIQSCDIGLSTQNPEGQYNATSFPSKVLMYLSNGLNVVSVDIPVLRESKVTEIIEYCKSAEKKDIAEAIVRVGSSKQEVKYYLEELDKEFSNQMKKIIGEL